MFFSSYFGIPKLWQPWDISDSICFNDDIFILHISMNHADERCHKSELWNSVCQVTCELKLGKRTTKILTEIFNNTPPQDASTLEDLENSSDANNNIIHMPMLDSMPEAARNTISNAYNSSGRALLHYLGIMCWRTAQPLPTILYTARRSTWSMDGNIWKDAPVNIFINTKPPIHISENTREIISPLCKNNTTAPLHYELFRDAWSHKDQHPRSSLILCNSALESAIKNLLSNRFPEIRWLIEDLPSPPMHTILNHIFYSNTRHDDATNPIPRPEDIKQVQTWTKKRNNIVHGKLEDINIDDLTKYLHLVQRILYMCDYANGESWALDIAR